MPAPFGAGIKPHAPSKAEGNERTKEKTMKINLKNEGKTEAALAAVNGKAGAHVICDVEQLEDLAERAELELERRGVTKAERPGCGLEFVPAGPSANYKYTYISTRVVLTRGNRDWFLTECGRFEGWPGQGELFNLRVTESALEQIKRAAVSGLVSADGKALVNIEKSLQDKIFEQSREFQSAIKELNKQLEHERRERKAAQRTIARLGGVDA